MAWRGNLSKSIKELRFLFCQTSPASSQTREFVVKNYTDLKTKNPKLPILIRECSGVEPQIWARYGILICTPTAACYVKAPKVGASKETGTELIENPEDGILKVYSCTKMIRFFGMGVERCVRLDGLTSEQINTKLEELAKAG